MTQEGSKPAVVLNSVGQSGLLLPIGLGKKKVKALLDTGSSITLLAKRTFNSLCQKSELSPPEAEVYLADGAPLEIMGISQMTVSVGNKEVLQKFWVAEIDSDCILGLDFLKQNDCSINLGRSTVQMGACEIECEELGKNGRCCRITVAKTVSIPSGHEQVITGKLVQRGLMPNQGLVEPTVKYRNQEEIMIGRALVNSTRGTVPIRVMNLMSDAEILREGTTVAILYYAEVVEDEAERCNQIGEGSTPPEVQTDALKEVPGHVKDLWLRSTENLDEDQREAVQKLLIQYQTIFSKTDGDLGRTGLVKHTIETGSVRPIRQPVRRIPWAQHEEAERQVKQMMENDLIQPSNSPWSSPIVLVKKKDGSMRFCIDYRRLNEVTLKDAYPLPRIDDSLDSLSGAQWFSTLDLASGYWQVELDPEDQAKTAFVTRSGLYEFKVLPFGLCNAPPLFERLMEQVLMGLQWESCLIYLDDIIVFGNSFEQEMSRLRVVFTRLKTAGLKLKPSKCHLFQKEVLYLGHKVSEKGIWTDPGKIEAVKTWPVPRNVRDVRSWLGLCSYYRRFIQKFAEVARPLHRLTEKGRTFSWDEPCEKAFQTLKERLITAPILAYPRPGDPFILDTDASDQAIGSVLSQKQDGQERVIAYASRALSKPERQYCVTRKELLAIVAYVKYFRHYLYGQTFLVRTDHGALTWLFKFKHPQGQVARWLEILGSYNFTIEHRPGRQHQNADALSRIPCKQCGWEEENAPSKEVATVSAVCTRSERTWQNWVDTYSPQDIRDQLKQDPGIVKCIRWKEAVPPIKPTRLEIIREGPDVKTLVAQWETLEVKEGLLYRLFRSEEGQVTWQLVLPSGLRKETLEYLHDSVMGGHLGTKRLLELVRKRFYWPRLSTDVKIWCQRCDLCAAKKQKRTLPAPMVIGAVGAPFEKLAVDILGPLPKSDWGNRYILVVADYFTKWVECFATPNQEAGTVADVLVREVVSRFGAPYQLHSDQGRNFEARLFQEMCKILGIHKTRTTPLRPQSDGMVERFNRTLTNMLSMFVSNRQSDWDQYLPMLVGAYRATEHESTGYSPNMLMLGREVTLPLDVMYPIPDQKEGETSVGEYATKLRERLEVVHEWARNHLKKNSERQKKYYDLNTTKSSIYAEGDLVWLYYPIRKKGLSPKLTSQWCGPCLVVERLSNILYKIRKSMRTKIMTVHVDRLKTYAGRCSWTGPPPSQM